MAARHGESPAFLGPAPCSLWLGQGAGIRPLGQQQLRADHSHPRTVQDAPHLPPGNTEDPGPCLTTMSPACSSTALAQRGSPTHSRPSTALLSGGGWRQITALPTEAILNLPQHMPSGLGRALWAHEDSGRPYATASPACHTGQPGPHPPAPAPPPRGRGQSNPIPSTGVYQIPPFVLQNLISFFGPPTVSEHFTIGTRPGSKGSRPTLRVRKRGRVQPGPQSPRFKPFLLPPPPSKRRPAHRPSRAALGPRIFSEQPRPGWPSPSWSRLDTGPQPCRRTEGRETRSNGASRAPVPFWGQGPAWIQGPRPGSDGPFHMALWLRGQPQRRRLHSQGAPSSPPLRGVTPTHSGAWRLGSLPSSWWEPPGHAGLRAHLPAQATA